jgi:hypothetical protein
MVCRTCQTDRDETEFRLRRTQCRKCDADIQAANYRANPELYKERSRTNRRNRREAINETNRLYREQNPDKARTWARRSKRKANGWAPGEWEAALERQGGLCAVRDCGRPATDADHCHATKTARGALCSGCNKALGLLGDSVARIQGLAEYLSGHQPPEPL